MSNSRFAPKIEKACVPLRLTKIACGCGTYRIEYHLGDEVPSFCPSCGKQAVGI